MVAVMADTIKAAGLEFILDDAPDTWKSGLVRLERVDDGGCKPWVATALGTSGKRCSTPSRAVQSLRTRAIFDLGVRMAQAFVAARVVQQVDPHADLVRIADDLAELRHHATALALRERTPIVRALVVAT